MKVIYCKQIHSDKIYIVTSKNINKLIPDCDGLITNLKNIKLAVKTADCVPITIKDDRKKIVGVVHAGWRGTEGEIVKNAINLIISKFNSNLKNIKIEMGPAIDKDNYLIKKDVASRFIEKYSKFLELVSENQWKFDLVGVNIKQLLDLGIPSNNIVKSKISTFNNKKYPSFRRDGKTKGFITSVWYNS